MNGVAYAARRLTGFPIALRKFQRVRAPLMVPEVGVEPTRF